MHRPVELGININVFTWYYTHLHQSTRICGSMPNWEIDLLGNCWSEIQQGGH